MNLSDLNCQYCCLKCMKNIHIFNNNILYCIDCGHPHIGIIRKLICKGCLSTYTSIDKITQYIVSAIQTDVDTNFICPSCIYIINNMGRKIDKK